MSDIGHANFSETANGNNASVPHGAPEGWAPSAANNVQREVMSSIKRDWNLRGAAYTTAGTANAQTLTPTVALAAYATGQVFRVKIGAALTNTGSATLNVSALGAKTMKTLGGDALGGGELQAGATYTLQYDGTDLILMTPFYERGTWTPALYGTGGSGPTFSVQAGRFTRIGNLVIATGMLTLSSGGTITGSGGISGLPYACANADGAQGAVTVYATGADYDTTDKEIVGYVVKNTTTTLIEYTRDASASGTPFASSLGNGDSCNFTITYETNA